MVGVAKSRGCATCRKRKIKCDENRPSCLRCMSSQFSCPGYAPPRLKFQDEGAKLRQKFPNTDSSSPLRIMSVVPMSSQERLSISFLETFQADLGPEKSLGAVFGEFITSVPRHSGVHRALDLAMKTLADGHREWLDGNLNANVVLRSRKSYSLALVEVQRSLSSGLGGRPIETLCAILLLGVYEVIACTYEKASMRHFWGAARLVEYLGPSAFVGSFALELIHAVRGITITQAIIAREPCFLDDPKWQSVLDKEHVDPQNLFHALFWMLQPLPNLLVALRRGRKKIFTGQGPELEKAETLRHQLQTWRQNPVYRKVFEDNFGQRFLSLPSLYTMTLDALKGLGIVVSYPSMLILVNLVIKGFSSKDCSALDLENKGLANEICQSYPFDLGFSPLGSSYRTFHLQVALSVTVDEEKREWIMEVIKHGTSNVKQWSW